MNWTEISIRTTHEATEAVANIFHDLGASGVVIEDPELVNSYRRAGAWDYCDIPEVLDTETVVVKAYLPADKELEGKLRIFKQRVNELAEHNLDKGQGLIECREIHEEDWANSWKEFFHPIKVGQRIVIKPSWEEYTKAADEIVIELDPGMAFGTGTHHTTTMCIRCLEEIIKPNDTVFDVGTGSGVLAVAAAKLGARKVTAVDFDNVAVRVALENAVINKVEQQVQVGQSDLMAEITGQADVIIANIIADIIIRMLPAVTEKLKDTGYFIASGIIAERLSDVTAAVLENKLIIERVIEEGGWAAMVIRKGGV
ncbi:MAG: 50S ribosomal protein L11 methyltransferase [Pelosinus sp.]|nr:50S ribosomal protein L11 methyltransferase [Pelosinus sp.]